MLQKISNVEIFEAHKIEDKKNQLSDSQIAHNGKLAEKYNPNGYFPYVVVLSPEGKVLGSLGYEKSTPEDYFKKLTAFEK